MSKSLARLVVGFAELVSAPLRPMRGRAVKVTASENLQQTVSVPTRYGELRFLATTRRALHYPWLFDSDEPETLAWIDRMPVAAILWDIGANIGMFSLYAALRKDLTVLAFEPAASSYAAMTRNIEINGLGDNLDAYCIAFDDKTSLDRLNMATTEAGSSMHGFAATINAFDQEIDIAFRQAAIGLSVDEFIRLFDPPRPTHLKIDVDGNEDRIISGAAETLRAGAISSIMVEIMGPTDSPRNAAIISLLEQFGFAPEPKNHPGERNIEFRR